MLAQFAFFGAVSAALAWAVLVELGISQLVPALRERGWMVAAVVGGGALIGITRASRVLHVLTGILLAVWLAVSLTPVAGRMARPLKTESLPVRADAVVVLSSAVHPDNSFTDAALARLVRGLELVQGKYAPKLVLTELGPPWGSYTAATQQLTARLGIACPIETLGPVRSTHDEAVLVSRLARDRGWKRILLVTSPTHSRRALLTFRRAGLDTVSVPCRETRYYLEDPRFPSDRLRAFSDALYEIIGLQVYRLRGWA